MSGIAVGVLVLLVLTLVTCQASECQPRDKINPCYRIKNRAECLTTKDSRFGKYYKKDCVWCLHECPDGNFCEPKNFLTGPDGNMKRGKEFESCLPKVYPHGKADIKSDYGQINVVS